MKRILILGASRYYIRSIEIAKGLGYHTLAVDKNPDAPGFRYADDSRVIDITDYQSVLAFAKEKNIDGIVPLNDFGVFTASHVSDELGLHYINKDTARIMTNKALLRTLWAEKGQPNPGFAIVTSHDGCMEACANIGFPVIFKPAVSMGGIRGVIAVEQMEEIPDAYAYATSFYDDKTILVEEFVQGIEHSAEVLIKDGKGHVMTLCDNIKAPLPSRVNKNLIYPTEIQGRQREKLQEIIASAVESIGIENGYAHIECCSLPSGDVKLFEMSARPGGGGIPHPIATYLTGVNLLAQHLRICVGEEPEHLFPLFEKGCNYHFIIPPVGKIKRISGIDEVMKWDGILDAAMMVKEGDCVRPARIGLDRAGFVIAAGNNREEALRLGRAAEEYIRIEYEAT